MIRIQQAFTFIYLFIYLFIYYKIVHLVQHKHIKGKVEANTEKYKR